MKSSCPIPKPTTNPKVFFSCAPIYSWKKDKCKGFKSSYIYKQCSGRFRRTRWKKKDKIKLSFALLAGWFIGWVGGDELKTSLLVLSLSFHCYSWLELCFAKPPSFSCLTVNNYLAKLLDPESTKYTACTLCIPCLPTQTILPQNIHIYRDCW